MSSICVFCGSSDGNNSVFKKRATELGKLFAINKLRLVYGGGHFGLMGAIADSILVNGGEVIGVIPDRLVQKERAHKGFSKLIIVKTMNERKEKMAELSDAFVSMPGGYGTLDEMFEMLTWNQLSIHNKPNYIYNINNFFDPLILQLNSAVENGFIKKELAQKLKIYTSANSLVEALINKD